MVSAVITFVGVVFTTLISKLGPSFVIPSAYIVLYSIIIMLSSLACGRSEAIMVVSFARHLLNHDHSCNPEESFFSFRTLSRKLTQSFENEK